jgi:threonine synthase
MTTCKCGRRMSKYANTCKACHKTRMAELHAEAQAIVATGKCPKCGLPLKRNLAITGWWQCSRCTDYPEPEYAQYQKCSFQCFTA